MEVALPRSDRVTGFNPPSLSVWFNSASSAQTCSNFFCLMPQLRRILQEAWRRSRDQWRSLRRVQCVEWKRPLDRSDSQCRPGTSAVSLSANTFLRCHDDWAGLAGPEAAETFSEIVEAEKDATHNFFEQRGKPGKQAQVLEKLQAEAVTLLPHEEVIPEAQGHYMYFQRPTIDGYIQFGRYPRNEPEAEEVILDTSVPAKDTGSCSAGSAGSGFTDLLACKVSDDHNLLAYIVDVAGDDSFELYLRPLAGSGCAGTVCVPGIRSVEFIGQAKNVVNLLAVRTDDATKRANQVLHLTMAGGSVTEHLLWEEQNPAAYLELFRTKNRRFILASSNTKDTSAVRYVPCTADTGNRPMDLIPLLEPSPGIEYFAEHLNSQDIQEIHRGPDLNSGSFLESSRTFSNSTFFVISNHERPDFAVYLLPENEAGMAQSWSRLKHFFTPPGDMHVTDADLLSNWLVLYGHESAAPRICVVPVAEPQSAYSVDLPSIGAVEPGVNANHDADHIRFTFRSPVEPGCTYHLDLRRGALTVEGKRTLDGSSMHSAKCERVDFAARDGERVPLTLLRPSKELGAGPCLLHVYGAYGSSMTPDFRPEHLMLLRRGWVLAWAHVRGGGERGRAWHQAGRQLHKSRSVLDLSDAVRFLLAQGIVAPGALCLKGSSAGGFTLGSLLNSREDAALIGAAILEVPFLDVLSSMADPLLPLTTHEYAEWGDPEYPEHEMNIRSLSPYENIGSHSYPHLYLSCALADARAPAWMTVKYAARMRARIPGYMSKNTGHFLG